MAAGHTAQIGEVENVGATMVSEETLELGYTSPDCKE